MSTESLYKKGLKVWIPHVNKVWEPAVILEDYNSDTKNLVIETELDREIKTLIITSNSDLPSLCYYEYLTIDEEENLGSLRMLHEAYILNNLRLRFENGCVYNYCGVTTVFINPFLKPLSNEVNNIGDYHRKEIEKLRPHIFAVAKKIYSRLEREKYDQSIIFTGKSGSGKTENAKKAILYLTIASAEEIQIKNNIIASSIIMESFGNAKTISNDNSSRFGKFIELQYNANYHIIGAAVKIFLLDRSRVVHQTKNEQNYNIFYEMCSVNDRFPLLQLDEQEFHYLNKKDSPEICSTYSKRFDEVIDAFNVLGFTVQQQDEILRILAAILHLGNLNFKKFENLGESENAKSCFVSDLGRLETLARLFSLDVKSVKAMNKWMCHRRIFSGQYQISQPLSAEEATKARDALAKFIYTKLFIWLVGRINFYFRSPCNVRSFIGILDIYGFEKLHVNLFEQFCINYANEKIEQNFIQSVFKLEQEEYLRDNIGWSFIKYQDNRLCIELIEGRHGLIDIIEQETNNKMPRESPWINAVFTSVRCKEAKHFRRPDCNSTDFIIHHFVDYVQYDSSEFLEKNRESVLREHLGILKDTKSEILNKLVMDEYYRTSIPRDKKKSRHKSRGSLSTYQTKTTIINEFRKSLFALTSTLQNTTPHYVRCMKSNDERITNQFDPVCVAKQIRAYNVLDTIKISSLGYFSRPTYADFFNRYHCLCGFDGIKRNDLQETCRDIIYTYIEDYDHLKFGRTKIFLDEESVLYLEKLRRYKRCRACTLIQTRVRCFLQHKRYQAIRRAVLVLQSQARKYLARRQARNALENQAAIKIQSRVRQWMSRRREQGFEPIARRRQNHVELYPERHNVATAEGEIMVSAATDIQRLFRGFLARRICEKRLRDIITIQACVRRFLAKIAVDKLKKNQDEQVQLLNKGLESQIDELQQKIDAYMEKNLTTEQLEEVQMIVDGQECIQAKNRILNQILFSKIRTLKDLAEKKVRPVEGPIVNDQYEQSRKVNKNSLNEVFKSLMSEEENFTIYQPLFQAAFNFDHRLEKFMEACGLSPSDLPQPDPSRRNAALANNRSGRERGREGIVNNYRGMFRFNISKIKNLLNRLIELPTSVLVEEEPGTPSRILFMCLRYIDSQNDLISATNMLQYYIKKVVSEVKKRGDIETILVWLVNTHQLLNYLKQYARIHNNIRDQFHTFNTDRQTEQCLKNLDLISLWGSLLEIAQWLALKAENLMKTTISDLALLGILEYNPVPNVRLDNSDADEQERDDSKSEVEEEAEEKMKNIEDIERDEALFNTQAQGQVPDESIQESPLAQNQQLPHQEQVQGPAQEQEQKQELPQEQVQEPVQELPQQQSGAQELAQEKEQELPQEQRQGQVQKRVQKSIKDQRQNQQQYLLLEEEYDENFLKAKRDLLLLRLTYFHRVMRICGISRKMTLQMFKQLFDFMSTILLSNIIAQPQLCNCYRGSLSRFNLRVVERWALYNKLTAAITALGPIKQAMRLLQMQPMYDDEIYSIIENYDKLNCNQILKILSCYKPAYAVDRLPSPSAMLKLQLMLEMNQEHDKTVLVNSEDYPISFPFRHCFLKLEEFEIPASFNISMLRKI